uniref:Uncharacterized protein n=1 Tax=Romanomermis culicivorax TaxID=13658 RepID=A0A915HGI4_ROMCU
MPQQSSYTTSAVDSTCHTYLFVLNVSKSCSQMKATLEETYFPLLSTSATLKGLSIENAIEHAITRLSKFFFVSFAPKQFVSTDIYTHFMKNRL